MKVTALDLATTIQWSLNRNPFISTKTCFKSNAYTFFMSFQITINYIFNAFAVYNSEHFRDMYLSVYGSVYMTFTHYYYYYYAYNDISYADSY